MKGMEEFLKRAQELREQSELDSCCNRQKGFHSTPIPPLNEELIGTCMEQYREYVEEDVLQWFQGIFFS